MGKKVVRAKNIKLEETVIKGMQEKKAFDITVMDLKNIKGAVADYFIICSVNSTTQADAICESIEKEVYKKLAENPWHKEGFENKEWILLDYVDVVAHIFIKETREFYGLEELWGDAKITTIEND